MKENNIIIMIWLILRISANGGIITKNKWSVDFFLSEATKIVNEYNWKYEIF